MTATAPSTVFDRLLDEAVPVLLAGTHRRDQPPVDGGRWPVTVVCRPGEVVAGRLEALMREALVHAGPSHFLTGRPDCSHVTVRALEPYREAAGPGDPVAAEWGAAMAEAARDTAPLRLRLTGVTLSTSTVMARLEPVGQAPWAFMRRLRAALGPHAWYEDQWQERDIWYASIVHFAAPLRDAAGLVGWARSRREVEPVDVVLDSVSLVRSRYVEDATGRRMAPEVWRTEPFAGPGAPDTSRLAPATRLGSAG